MDWHKLSEKYFSNDRLETGASKLSQTNMIGTALSDSENGYVKVLVDGDVTYPDDSPADGVYIATGPSVKEGDQVHISMNGGVGKSPIVSNAAGWGDKLNALATEAADAAAATNQHFWHRSEDPEGDGAGTGAFVTDTEQETFLEAAANDFPDYDPESKPYNNLLMNSLGIFIRTALRKLVSITKSAVTFFDGNGNESSNIVASFGSNGAVIGSDTTSRVLIDNNGFLVTDEKQNPMTEMQLTNHYISTYWTDDFKNSVIVSGGTFSVTMEGEPYQIGEHIGVYVTLASSYGTPSWCSGYAGFLYGTAASDTFNLTQSSTAVYTGSITYDGDKTLQITLNKVLSTFTNPFVGQASVQYKIDVHRAPEFTFGTRSPGYSHGILSTTIGEGLIADSDYQVTLGKYNQSRDISGEWYRFVFGWGSADNNRKNLMALDEEGNLLLGGNVTAGGLGSGGDVIDAYGNKLRDSFSLYNMTGLLDLRTKTTEILPAIRGGTGLNSLPSLLKVSTSTSGSISAGATHTTIDLTIPSGYTFVCFFEARTNGWVGSPYIAKTTTPSTGKRRAEIWWTVNPTSSGGTVSVDSLCIYSG